MESNYLKINLWILQDVITIYRIFKKLQKNVKISEKPKRQPKFEVNLRCITYTILYYL